MANPILLSKHLTPWNDPESGVRSYILTGRVASYQQSFYFTNRSLTDDGRYLWFYCAFPPAGDANFGRTLGVLDVEADELRHFPETQFLDASPMVDNLNGDAYWCNKTGIWRRGPRATDAVERIARLPDEWFAKGTIHRIATHLTFSADRSDLNIDAELGNRWFVGSVSLSSGKFTVWQEFERCYNHGQFSPTDPDLMLIAQDFWSDKATGERHVIDRNAEGQLYRMWLIRRGESAQPLMPKFQRATHEWWSADGRAVYYVDGQHGTIRIDLANGERKVMNPYGTWHAHASANERYFVADVTREPGGFYRGGAADVIFYSGETHKLARIARLPALNSREEQSVYHPDPHPQFADHDELVVYTTTVHGRLDVALTPVETLIQATTS